MEPSDEIVRLLTQIRDAQRENVAEYQRISQESMALNKTAVENANAHYKASLRVGRGTSWALLILIVVCVMANFLMLVVVAGRK